MSINRGNDNFISSYDYLKNQLFVYDYNDSDHRHILKLKIWTLDGPLTQAEINEGLEDKDVSNPVNHYESLLNELTYLDKYIRTQDELLGDTEPNFDKFSGTREKNYDRWIKKIKDEDTGEFYQDWEQAYNQRVTLITDAQFQELYTLYKQKESNGELTSTEDIIYSVSRDNLDKTASNQESTISMTDPPEETEAQLFDSGEVEAGNEDDNLVKEMNIAFDELREIILTLAPEVPEGPATEIPDPEWDGIGEQEMIPNPIQWSANEITCVNMPTKREYVGHAKNHSSHKGMIIEQLQEGGYRFTYKTSDLLTIYSIDKEDPNLVISVSGDLFNQLEQNFDSWFYAHFYTESDSEAGTSTSYFKPLGIDFTNLSNEQKVRHDELNARWTNANNTRENIIMNSGTRIRVESMFNAEIPDLKPEHERHLTDRVDQKELTINILRERTLFGEFI